MDGVDRITKDGKKAIADILNKGLVVEYTHIVNYPRFIDQMVNILKLPSDDLCVKVLERLGKESIRHANIVMHLVVQLGGEPHLLVEPVDRMSDIGAMLQQQMGKEEENLSVFKWAKTVAQENQVKKIRGIIELNIRVIKNQPDDMVQRSTLIKQLAALGNDEVRHMGMLKTVMAELNYLRQK